MSFVSSNDGWVLGSVRCAGRLCAALMRTYDGGRTWTRLPNPPYPITQMGASLPGAQVGTIRFATTKVGWAFGSALWLTRDGGRTWNRDTTFGSRTDQAVNQVVALETAAGRTYALVHTGEGNGCTELEQTSISVEAWTTAPAVGGCGANLEHGALALHGDVGWVLTEYGGAWYYHRLVSGRWQPARFPCGSLGPVWAAVAADSTSQVAIECSGPGAAGQTDKQTFLSSDGGRTFSRINHEHSAGDDVLLALSPDRVLTGTWSAASWIYSQSLHASTTRTVLTAADGGTGWRDLGLTTTTQGVIIEGANLPGTAMYMTRDGGRTWKLVTFSPT